MEIPEQSVSEIAGTEITPETSPSPIAIQTDPLVPEKEPTPSQPTILATYAITNVPYHPGGMEGVLLAMPDQLWITSMFSGVKQWDPQTGKELNTLEGLDAQIFFDMKYDGTRLWVLAAKDTSIIADALFAVNFAMGDVEKEFPITGEGDYGTDPTKMGISPGKIWVNFGVVDTETMEYTSLPDGLPSEAHFAYDGEQWMWVTGSWCHGCEHDLWLIDANNPDVHKDNQNSGVLGTGVLGNPLLLAGGRMWVYATYYSGNETGYFLDVYQIQKTNLPELHIDVTEETKDGSGQVVLAADDHMVWLAASGMLYYFDVMTGEKIGELKIGEYIDSMGFDGTSLWVLSSDTGLVKIFLPWEP